MNGGPSEKDGLVNFGEKEGVNRIIWVSRMKGTAFIEESIRTKSKSSTKSQFKQT